MFDFAIGAFLLAFLGFLCLVTAGAPMVRAAERQHGLKAAQDEAKKLRGERAAERNGVGELLGRRDEAAAKLAAMRVELRKIEEDIGRLPKQSFELTFEFGTDAGQAAFDFLISRHPNSLDSTTLSAPERNLWKLPRVARAWNRNQAAALAVVEKRFRQADGFSVRVAERIDHTSAAGA
ncbi:MAG TPA: hypothetical protein VM689_12700 [Aliidongia sp.]|nr:hypothetical protein [Aliidongia sp.]